MEEIKVIVHLKESELNNLIDALDFCVSNHCYYYDLLLKFERLQEKVKIAKENTSINEEVAKDRINAIHPDPRLKKISDLVDGTIDHFDRDDAMDLLYHIKNVLKERIE